MMLFIGRTLATSAWLYLFAVVAVGIVLRTGGERWWWATVMLFAPRWVWGIPLVVLVPMAGVVALWSRRSGRRKQGSGFRVQGSAGANNPSSFIAYRSSHHSHPSSAIVPVVLASVWVAWPLMGLCVSARGVLALFAESPKSEVQSPKSGARTASTESAIFHSPGRNPGKGEGSGTAEQGTTIRVLTCNVGLEGYDEAALAKLIEETQPDVVTLQEGYENGSGSSTQRVPGVQGSGEGTGNREQGTGEEKAASTEGAIVDSPGRSPGRQKTDTDGLGRPSSDHPSSFISHPSSWHVSANPGILVASRFPIVSQQTLERKNDYGGTRTVAVACQLDTGKGSIAFVALHLYTPRKGLMNTPTRPWEGNEELELNTSWRSQESADVAKWIKSLPGPVIVAGDMNLTPDSEVFRRDWSSYTDAFTAAGFGYGYTYGYDASRPFWGIRIDHVLADTNWRVERCWVGPHIHSDHRPVLTDSRLAEDKE